MSHTKVSDNMEALIKLALENSRDLSWVATIISDEVPRHVEKFNNKTEA